MNPRLLAAYKAAALPPSVPPPSWSDPTPLRPPCPTLVVCERKRLERAPSVRPSIFKPRDLPVSGPVFVAFYPLSRRLRPRPLGPHIRNRK